MSTKAERKRKENIKKKISICFKIFVIIVLIVLGIVYCYSTDEDASTSDVYEISKNNSNSGKAKNISDSVPAVSDIKKDSNQGHVSSESGSYARGMMSSETTNENLNELITDDSLDSSNSSVDDSGNTAVHDDRVNINTASVLELCKLNGIGEKRARDIIEYRENVGKFEKIEDIMKVKGIKQGVFSKIKDYIKCG